MDRHRAASTGTILMKQSLLIAFVLLLGACAKSGDDAATFDAAHDAAVAAIAYSAERGHAWSTADALLEQAVAANTAGDETLAIELANSARGQAELAAEQADTEEKTWSGRVLSD